MSSFFVMLFCAALVWGASAGMLGVFMTLRRQSLLADAFSHASLPGIVVAFLISGSTHPTILFLGASAAGILAFLFILIVKQSTHLGYDALLGIVIALFYGSGIALLTYVQRSGGKEFALLSKFLLGNIALISFSDVVLLLAIALTIFFVGILFWKELVLLSFDREYGVTIGYSAFKYDMLFILLLVAIISTGMQIGGAVVTSALLVAPAITARYCSTVLWKTVVWAAFFGASATFLGCFFSYTFVRVPAGPAAVCCAVLFLCVALIVKREKHVIF